MNKELMRWLRADPPPSSLLADGKPVQIGRGGAKWRHVIDTIESLAATKIEALASDGSILRATTIEEEESTATLKSGISDVQTFARLLAEAYNHGSKNPLLDNAMQFIERQAQRIAQQEREIDRLRMLVHKMQGELMLPAPASEGGGVLEAIAGGFMQKMAEQGAAAVVAAPNGQQPKGKR